MEDMDWRPHIALGAAPEVPVIAGDGIGVDVVREGVKVLRAADDAFKLGRDTLDCPQTREDWTRDSVLVSPNR